MTSSKPSGKDPNPTHHMQATYNGWIDLQTGEGIDVREIIRGLAHQCRYAGQTHRPYTIAQHSCLCHEWARAEELGPRLRRAALLHDAAEAYAKDLPRPLKRAVGEGYESLLRRLERRMAGLYDYPYPLPKAVKTIDHKTYLAERRGIASHPDIDTTDEVDPPESVERLMTSIWRPRKSADRFAHRVAAELEGLPLGWDESDLDDAQKETYLHFTTTRRF